MEYCGKQKSEETVETSNIELLLKDFGINLST